MAHREEIATALLSLRGAAFSREELATWRDVAIHKSWIASLRSQ